MKGEWECRIATFALATIVDSKNKNIHLRDFKDVDFNFTRFANFKFAYFEIEECFGLIWVKLQNGRFHLQIPFWVLIFALVSQIMLFHFVYKKEFWHILVKFVVYKVSLLSSRSNKKHFTLIDLVIGRL